MGMCVLRFRRGTFPANPCFLVPTVPVGPHVRTLRAPLFQVRRRHRRRESRLAFPRGPWDAGKHQSLAAERFSSPAAAAGETLNSDSLDAAAVRCNFLFGLLHSRSDPLEHFGRPRTETLDRLPDGLVGAPALPRPAAS